MDGNRVFVYINNFGHCKTQSLDLMIETHVTVTFNLCMIAILTLTNLRKLIQFSVIIKIYYSQRTWFFLDEECCYSVTQFYRNSQS